MKDVLEMYRSKRADERERKRIAFREMVGFNERDETYVPLRMTEEVVRRMKEVGAEYNRHLGFHTPHPVDGVKMGVILFSEVCDYDEFVFRWRFLDYKCKAAVGRVCKTELTEDEKNSQFIGNLGERISLGVTLYDVQLIPSHSDFGDFCRMTFKSANGKLITWFQRMYGVDTVRAFFKRYGDKGVVQLTGTVHAHRTVRSVMTTNVKNCVLVGRKNMTLTLFHKIVAEKGA